MTAIHGLWRFDGRDAAADFRRMDQALARYGDDDHQIRSVDPALAMGCHLHRAVPEDRFPSPVNAGNRYIVVADVRLTEREDLALQLELGEEAARMSDAALAARAIETWDESAFDRIYGAFAIAAWDTRERRLLLARDPFGHKPLFYHSAEQFFAFASMPAGLHALPDIPRGPDAEAMKRFLALEKQNSGETHYDGICRVMPGHYATVTASGLTEKRYWYPDLTPLRFETHQDYIDALSERLDRAVAAALRGVDRQVAAHLSSGFDSTAVTTTAARLLAARGGKVVAYTAAPRAGYEDRLPGLIADESVLAEATAAMHPNIEHVVIRSDRAPTTDLSRTASIYGMPILNICNLAWTESISDDAARRGITVLLEAPMGNITISDTGMSALPELLRSGRFVAWLKLVPRLIRNGSISWPKILWYSFNPWLPNRLYRWIQKLRWGDSASPARNSALKQAHFRSATAKSAAEPGGWNRPSSNSLDARIAFLAAEDYGAVSKGMLGQWKIDHRDPTADRRLVEFSLRLPAEELIHDGKPRALLRQVLADRAPSKVLDNARRGYQAADWHEWLNDAREEVIAELARIEMFEPTENLFDVDRLKALIDDWPERDSDKWTDYASIVDYRLCLLRAVSAASFMRQASGSNY